MHVLTEPFVHTKPHHKNCINYLRKTFAMAFLFTLVNKNGVEGKRMARARTAARTDTPLHQQLFHAEDSGQDGALTWRK